MNPKEEFAPPPQKKIPLGLDYIPLIRGNVSLANSCISRIRDFIGNENIKVE